MSLLVALRRSAFVPAPWADAGADDQASFAGSGKLLISTSPAAWGLLPTLLVVPIGTAFGKASVQMQGVAGQSVSDGSFRDGWGTPSTDEQAAQLADGQSDRFAAWTVESHEQDQIVLCDYQGRTRSWLMVEPMLENGTTSTRLFFGSAVVSATDRRTGRKFMRILFRLLLGFHRRYAKALLRSAVTKLAVRPILL